MNTPKKPFSKMDKSELLDFVRGVYDEKGLVGLTYENLSSVKGLYYNLYRVGLPQKKIIKELGLEIEFKQFKAETFVWKGEGFIRRGWTWKRVLEEAREVVSEHGFLPPAGWFQQNGNQAIVQGVYNLGKTWEDLRDEFSSFENSGFVESRNGIRWRSHPEASLSNFLYARGIEHKRGEKYPQDFKDHSESNYAYFDLHFLDKNGIWNDVEVWGDKPNGHAEKIYSKKRGYKENYNKNNLHFLGIEFRDCFREDELSLILDPFIGKIEPFIFEKPHDKIIHTTHWSNADELIEYCREIASQQPDGVFPSEEWLRKRGKFSSRDGETYNTVSIYIKTWIGGIRKLRKILGQEEHSTVSWTKEKALAAYKEWFEQYNCSPDRVRSDYRRNKNNSSYTHDEAKKAASLCNSILKYAGGAEAARRELGIQVDKTRNWTKEKILESCQFFFQKYGLTPHQLLYECKKHSRQVPDVDMDLAKKLTSAISYSSYSIKQLCEVLDFKPTRKSSWPRKG